MLRNRSYTNKIKARASTYYRGKGKGKKPILSNNPIDKFEPLVIA